MTDTQKHYLNKMFEDRLKKVLTELFDKPVPIKWTTRKKYVAGIPVAHSESWEGDFEIDNIGYKLWLEPGNIATPGNIIFASDDGYNDEIGEYSFPSHHFGITGSGSANLVFATILHGIRQWLDTAKPIAFSFTAKEPSRRKLYNRLARMLPKNYEVQANNNRLETVFNVVDITQV